MYEITFSIVQSAGSVGNFGAKSTGVVEVAASCSTEENKNDACMHNVGQR